MKLRNKTWRIVPEHFVKSAHIYRQIIATFAAAMLSVTGGIAFGFTAVLLPQLEGDESFAYDKSFDSWIASISPLAMIVGCLFSGAMSDRIGRKMGQIVLIVSYTIAWTIMGLSNDNSLMLIGRFLTGICGGAIRPNTIVYIGELTDPQYRAITLFMPSMALQVGSLISHTVGKYVYWRTCCFLFILPNIVTLTILIFLKESPLWLLTNGKIDEGIHSFRQFRGKGDRAEKELTTVLEKSKQIPEESSLREFFSIIFTKPFLKSLTTIFLLFVAVQWSGINTLSFYAQEIFEKTFFGDIDAFLLTVLTDCIRTAAVVALSIFAKNLPRKITFVTSCFSSSFALVALVIYLYIRPGGLVWLAVTCVVAYIAIASVLTCISWSLVAEIFPSKVRGFGSGLSSAISYGLLFISVKVTPEIMNNFGVSVMFGEFACAALITGVFLIFILPETNGKSLQDIEDTLYKDNTDIKSNIDIEAKPSNQQGQT